jgi:glutamine synthetase
MISEPIALLDVCEIAGRARAKGFPVTDLSAKLKSRVGWMPTNTMISALGPIADTAFGATSDMVLVPNPASELKVDFEDGSAPNTFPLASVDQAPQVWNDNVTHGGKKFPVESLRARN